MLATTFEKSSFSGIKPRAIVLDSQRGPQNWMLLQPFSTLLPNSIDRPLADDSIGI